MSLREFVKARVSPEQRRKIRALINAGKWPFVKPLGFWRRRGLNSRLPFTGGRNWRSAIPFDLHYSIQQGKSRQTYRDVPFFKHPMELALYSMLIWNLKPKTIIEIGSYAGGSALWMADQMRTFGIDGRMVSIDLAPPQLSYQRVDIEFLRGDGNQLGDCLTPEFLSTLRRPLLVIEDSSHHYAVTLAVLRFFDAWMKPGEYIVVEDGFISDMGRDSELDGGPGRAISQFLLEGTGRYEIDSSYCDYFGHNVTGNTNGYLRRTTR